MKSIQIFILFLLTALNGFSQQDSMLKMIFVPHPRSDDKVNQSTLPGLEKIDYSKFDMVILGGDLTYYTSTSRVSMDYCNSLFDLDSPNTLWTMGNHDLTNPSLIKEFTGKSRYYAYYRDSITFFVLDTEDDAKSFQSSYISGNQLDSITKVCDTITQSAYFILIHHRLLWMIGNDYFKEKLDSVAQSTNQLDTTNFYQVVYPMLQKVKSKGIKVLCLGGDKSKLNIDFSPEDSITFLTSTMEPAFSDNENDVLVLSYNKNSNAMDWKFIPVDEIEQRPDTIITKLSSLQKTKLNIWQGADRGEIKISFLSDETENATLRIFNMQGILLNTLNINNYETKNVAIEYPGTYIIQLNSGKSISTKKVLVF